MAKNFPISCFAVWVPTGRHARLVVQPSTELTPGYINRLIIWIRCQTRSGGRLLSYRRIRHACKCLLFKQTTALISNTTDELRARLRKMTDAELVAFGKAARSMRSPAPNMRKPHEVFLMQLREAYSTPRDSSWASSPSRAPASAAIKYDMNLQKSAATVSNWILDSFTWKKN